MAQNGYIASIPSKRGAFDKVHDLSAFLRLCKAQKGAKKAYLAKAQKSVAHWKIYLGFSFFKKKKLSML